MARVLVFLALPCWAPVSACFGSSGVEPDRGASAPLFLEVFFMVVTMVTVVMNLIDVFCTDSLGNVVVSVCVMGSCIALFRVMRRAAGG